MVDSLTGHSTRIRFCSVGNFSPFHRPKLSQAQRFYECDRQTVPAHSSKSLFFVRIRLSLLVLHGQLIAHLAALHQRSKRHRPRTRHHHGILCRRSSAVSAISGENGGFWRTKTTSWTSPMMAMKRSSRSRRTTTMRSSAT